MTRITLLLTLIITVSLWTPPIEECSELSDYEPETELICMQSRIPECNLTPMRPESRPILTSRIDLLDKMFHPTSKSATFTPDIETKCRVLRE